jgi:hypothetical protein
MMRARNLLATGLKAYLASWLILAAAALIFSAGAATMYFAIKSAFRAQGLL